MGGSTVRVGIAGRPEGFEWLGAAAPGHALEMRPLRRCAQAGGPFGEQEFLALFEERFKGARRKWGF
jgi:hypothetical protein